MQSLLSTSSNLTTKPTVIFHCQADEKARIEAAGGTVVRFGVWRVSGILAMSRALGDYTLKHSKYVIADPDIRTFELDGDVPEFLVLATDTRQVLGWKPAGTREAMLRDGIVAAVRHYFR